LGFITPTYSALCKSRKKIPTEIFDKMLGLTINFKPKNVGIDSTGISIFIPSFHFVQRIDRDKTIKSFVKVSAFFDLDRKKFLSIHSKIDKRHDVNDFEILFKKQNSFKNLFADTAYDSEKVHETCFKNKIQTFIKPRKNVKRGFYRRKQMKNYSESIYHKRSLIECGFSVLKRKFGGYSLAKSNETTAKEVYLRAIASNLNLRS
jgi:transposase